MTKTAAPPTTITVNSQRDLNNAIETVNASTGSFDIEFGSNITEGQQADQPAGLYDLYTADDVTINGNGFTLNGGGVAGGISVPYDPNLVTIENLTIEDTVAKGGAGSGGGGGGAGLGGGLFVGPGAVITLNNVLFSHDKAVGGQGGLGGGGGAGGNSSLLFDLAKTAATNGAAGAGTTASHGNPGGIGSTGTTGVKGGAGGAGAPGEAQGLIANALTHAGIGGTGGIGGAGGFGAGGGGGGQGGQGGAGYTGYVGANSAHSLAPGGPGGAGGSGGHGGGATSTVGATESLSFANFGGGGGGGGQGGRGGTGGKGAANALSATNVNGGTGGVGGTGGTGGLGGFGGGGGGGGAGGKGGNGGAAGTGTTGARGANGITGAAGAAGQGGFGGGSGGKSVNGGGGGGGLGAGGDIFVAAGGILVVEGGMLSGGSAVGGAGGANAGAGKGYGSGIFFGSIGTVTTGTITLAAPVGKTQVFADQIADPSGEVPSSTGSNAGALTLDIGFTAGNFTGTVNLAASNKFSGGVVIEAGTLELGVPGAAGAGAIQFGGADNKTLLFAATAAPSNPIEQFDVNDTIEVTGFVATGSLYSGNELTLTGANSAQVSLVIPGHSLSDFKVVVGATNTTITTTVDANTEGLPCYVRGTKILTIRGEVAVEDLVIGDHVVTAGGQTRPVVWLGHRSFETSRHPAPQNIWPVVVRAAAFGAAGPARDLWLSPGHNIVAEGVLMPIIALQNGCTVDQVRRPRVEYWHVELDAHDIMIAEGLPAESYLDTGNRTDFINGGDFIEQHPDRQPSDAADTCLPLVKDGPEMQRARATLYAEITGLGYELTEDHDLHIVANGKRYSAVPMGERRYGFMLPRGCASIALCSRSFIPAAMEFDHSDLRRLGICVERLEIDGKVYALDDETDFTLGWHGFERHSERLSVRWTDGEAQLPGQGRLILVDVAAQGQYFAAPAPEPLRLAS